MGGGHRMLRNRAPLLPVKPQNPNGHPWGLVETSALLRSALGKRIQRC